MKKLFSLIMAVVLCACSVCYAEGIDFSALSTEELHQLFDGVRNELVKRELVAAENLLVFDQDGVALYLTGEVTYSGGWLNVGAVLVNNTENEICLGEIDMCVNGFATGMSGITDVPAGKSKAGKMQIMVTDVLSSAEDLKTIESGFRAFDRMSGKNYMQTEVITIHFNVE